METSTHEDWAAEEFGHARLHDRRAVRRLLKLGAAVSVRPAGKLTKCLVTGAEREAGYRFMNNESIKPAEIGLASSIAALGRAAGEEFIFVPVDGTSLAITDGTGEKGLGLIGARSKQAHGFNVMSALAVDRTGTPLGLLDQVFWTRRERSTAPPEPTNDRRPVEVKETQHWIDVLDAVSARRDQHAEGTRLWFQFDRGGDANAVLNAMVGANDWLTVRCCTNRRIESPDDDREYLFETIEEQPVGGYYDLQIKGTSGRTARAARMSVRWLNARIRVTPSTERRCTYHDFNFVLALEDGTAPAGEEPIKWILTTNRPVGDFDEALEVIQGYTFRWRCEEFHRAWKSGCCDIESTQLRSADAIERLARITAAVAIRVVGLTYAARRAADQPALEMFDDTEVALLRGSAIKNKWCRKPPPVDSVTVQQATEWLARLGGYTGRSSGGPPGQITLTRGLQRLAPMLEALRLIHMLDL